MFASGLVLAEESPVLSSRRSTTIDTGFNIAYGSGQMTEHVVDQRIIDRLGLLDAAGRGQSSRYNVEVDLENEDSDWSFEVTVTVEF